MEDITTRTSRIWQKYCSKLLIFLSTSYSYWLILDWTWGEQGGYKSLTQNAHHLLMKKGGVSKWRNMEESAALDLIPSAPRAKRTLGRSKTIYWCLIKCIWMLVAESSRRKGILKRERKKGAALELLARKNLWCAHLKSGLSGAGSAAAEE